MITLFEHPEIRELYIVIYDNGHVLGSIYMEVDGFYVFQFGVPAHSEGAGFDMPERNGFWEAWVLRMIADTLDGMNEAWIKEIDNHLDFVNETKQECIHEWRFVQSASGNESWHECVKCGHQN